MRVSAAMQLGIDFGTTRTVVACADRGNYPVVDFVDHEGDRASAIPSIAAARDGELLFGFDAARVAFDPSYTVLPSFKRLLSSPAARSSQPVRLGDTVVSLGKLLTGFFEYVRDAVLERSTTGRRRSRAPAVLEASVAVPAHALGAQRLVTLDAFRSAGFEVGVMLNEPSAAGFEYTHRHRETLSARRDLVVVYDLGGGTFDASAVRMSGNRHEVLASAGIPRLGGDDFDEVLARTALLQVDLDLATLPSRAARALLAQCKEAKERLHPTSRKIALDLDAALGRLAPKPEIVLKVADYYAACQPLVDYTIDAMLPVMTRFEEEARAPDLADIAGIYVVGGGSELPVVTRLLRERFGRRVHRSPYASAAVAIGLALAADGAADFSLVDRYAHTFGVFREGDAGRQIIFDPIFAPDTQLPTRASAPLTETRAYRAAHNVGHYRFFECSALDGSGKPHGDMTLYGDVHFPFEARLADADVASVPVERRPGDGPRIEERYSLDERGVVVVVIRNLDAGYERSYRLGLES
jgi:molecular chaperone DnaK (HSP70)